MSKNMNDIVIPEILDNKVIPESIAIILDGNRRYAKKNNIDRTLGHKAGFDNLEVMLEVVADIGVKYFTVYAFSTENWKRSEDEIASLRTIFMLNVARTKKKANEKNVKIVILGDITKFKKDMQDACIDLEESTKDNTGMVFAIALNYGGRPEIIKAVNEILANKNVDNITEEEFSKYLYTKDIKDPDLIIRPGGEYRLSNFLLWQCAYSELYFTNKLWPEFDKNELYNAILDYNTRERRFGGKK